MAAERRPGSGNWEHSISSLRVVVRPPCLATNVIIARPRFNRREAEEMVRRAYRHVLGREVDQDGLRAYREKLLENDWNEGTLRADLRHSPEFHALNPDEVIAASIARC